MLHEWGKEECRTGEDGAREQASRRTKTMGGSYGTCYSDMGWADLVEDGDY